MASVGGNLFFKVSEFKCKCKAKDCSAVAVNVPLLMALERVRKALGNPIEITSGVRCSAHNKRVGGARKSQHVLGMAADIKTSPDFMNRLWELCLKEYGFKGLGDGRKEGEFIHVDTREQDERIIWVYPLN